MKKRAVAVAILAVLLSLWAWSPGAYAYLSDLWGHWAAGTITALEARGIVAGGGDGRFRPDEPLTRAQLAKMLVAGMGYDVEASLLRSVQSRYTDIPFWHWSRGYVEAAAELGLLQGYPDGRFAPDAPITRAELAMTAVRAAALAEEAAASRGELPPYVDGEAVPAWARGAVTVATAEGLMLGMPDGRFHPEREVTRAEGAAVVYRLLARSGELFHIAGTLIEFDPNTRSGVVRDSAGVEHAFQMGMTALFMRGEEITLFTEIRPPDEVVIILDDAGAGVLMQASYVDLLAEEAAVVGGDLLLRFASGEERRIAVNPGAILLVNGHAAALADLDGAGPLYAALDSRTGGIRLVHALKDAAVGWMLGYAADGERVRLAVDFREQQVVVSPDVVVLVGAERGDMSRVLPGDPVRFALDDAGRLAYVEVLR